MSTVAADLRGQIAVISGAGSGIGEGLARHAAARLDMTVVVSDVDVHRAEGVAASIRSGGGKAAAVQADVADRTSVAALAATVLGEVGTPALLVCNAGVEITGLVWETDPRQWERVQAINVNGAFNLMRAFLPGMIQRGDRGHVLCTSSVGGLAVSSKQSAYTVSKHGIRVLAQSLAADLESVQANVGVSILLPGAVRTRIFDDAGTTGSAGAEAFRAELAAHLADDGLSPTEVAATTFEQLTKGGRWIHTHASTSREVLVAHVEELLAGLPAEV